MHGNSVGMRTERAHGNRRDLHNLRSMLPFLLDFRGRVLFALACLVLAKVANVGIPMLLKGIVDGLDKQPGQVLVLPVILLLGYGLLRLLSSLFNELRDAIFAKVRYRAMRRLSTRVLEHLHQMSLRFHLERRTGGISRDLERGTRSVSSIMNVLTFSIIPTAVEFTLIAVILLSNYDVLFAVVTFATVALYVFFTLKVTEWRMDYRHEMNRLDSQANNRAIDSLINYETVKYFNNEHMERQRYDETLAGWEDNAVKSQTSMSLLNFGQQAIIALGVMLIMFLAANGVVEGSMTIGDLVMVNAFMLQLFMPLSVLGMVYRQIKYTLADMDTVFRLLEQAPEIRDQPGAAELQISRGEIRFDQVDFAYHPERPILQGVSFTVPAGAT
ncbi:MAG: ABC transporter ATP-binding protein/permease, partial [Thiolinea sp.]